jgi:hypothetical protein
MQSKPTKSSNLPIFVFAMLFMGVAILLLVGLLLVGSISLAQEQLVIRAGERVSGEVSNRLGQEWIFQGCASDVITLTASSRGFVPFLALFDAAPEDVLIEAEGSEETLSAQINAFPLPRNDTYTLLVAGSSVLDRGPYSLTLASSATTTLGGADTPQIFSGQRITGAVTSRFGTEFLFQGCANDVVTVTLESALFAPHLELFGPSGRQPLIANTSNTAGTDAQINGFALPEAGLYTLVAAGENIRDRGLFTLAMTLAGGEAITASVTPTPTQTSIVTPTNTLTPAATLAPTSAPTLTPLPTATPTPLPTLPPSPTAIPTPQPSVLQPRGVIIQVNGGDGDLVGELFMNPSYMISALEEDDTIVVRDRFYLELFVFDPRVGRWDGAGIDRVEFEFSCPNGEGFRHVERTPRYCSFGGGEPNCSVLRLRTGEMFPGTSCEIVNDYYSVNITAYPVNDHLEEGNWNFNIRPELPE